MSDTKRRVWRINSLPPYSTMGSRQRPAWFDYLVNKAIDAWGDAAGVNAMQKDWSLWMDFGYWARAKGAK